MSSIKVILKTEKANAKGEHPLYLRVITNRKTQFVALGHYLLPEQWDEKKEKAKKNHPNSARLNNKIADSVARVQAAILQSETDGKLIKLSEVLFGQTVEVDFFSYADQHTNRIKEQGRIGYYRRGKSVIEKLKQYVNRPKLPFDEMTVAFLKTYQSYLVTEFKNSSNTIHANFRYIKTIVKAAAIDGLLKKNPFDDYKLKQSTPERVFLTKKELDCIEQIEFNETQRKLTLHRDLFVFASYCGLRISDLLMLKGRNFDGERISFKIKKTKEPLSIKLPNTSKAILMRYWDSEPNHYIFPVFDNDVDYSEPAVLHNAISSGTAYINKNLKFIAQSADIDKNISFHASRHTFATMALKSGMRIEYLSKILGHRNLRETQIYAKIVNEDLDNAMSIFDKEFSKDGTFF